MFMFSMLGLPYIVLFTCISQQPVASFHYPIAILRLRKAHGLDPTITTTRLNSNGLNEPPNLLTSARQAHRRHILAYFGAVGINFLNKDKCLAEGDQDINDPRPRVILQTNSRNIPKRYVGTSPSAAYEDNIEAQFSQKLGSIDTVEDRREKPQVCVDPIEEQRIAVFERAAPSVVYIDTFVEQRDAFTTNILEVPLGTGSGIVWDDRGHIVTNYHVVRNAVSAQIAILTRVFPDDKDKDTPNTTSLNFPYINEYNGIRPPPKLSIQTRRNDMNEVAEYTRKVYKASVVGVDPGKDLAVLKIDAPVFDLYPIELGVSKGLRVGQTCYAIGNPYGLDHSLTSGVVSGIGREVKSPIGRPITNVIQTDAAINPGNSGGPLLDSSGRMIGINTSIFSPSGGSAGIGFAIPVDTVKYIVDLLIRDGKVVRPVMGITYLQSSQARTLGITKGVLVLDVPPNSAASKAGMKGTRRTESGLIEIGDIIVQIEDMKIDSETDLLTALESFKPGVVVKVVVNRPNVEGTPSNPRLTMTTKTLYLQLKASADMTTPQYLFLSPE